jgi:proline dehydrogenase
MNKHIEEVVSQMTPEQVNEIGIRLMTEKLEKAKMELSMWKAMVETTENHIDTINYVIRKFKGKALL